MTSDYVDNWDALPPAWQEALGPIIADFDSGADLLFDRRRNLSFEAAVTELSVPGIVAVTEGLRRLRALLERRVTVANAAEGRLLFDRQTPLTAYDLPLYMPCVYISQIAQEMDTQNVRVWKDATAMELGEILLVIARYVRPDIETARVVAAALCDMVFLYPQLKDLLQQPQDNPNAESVAETARRMTARFDTPRLKE